MKLSDDFDDEEFTEESGCGCTFDHEDDEVCPECCDFGGVYSPGTEECEFCPWRDQCEEDLMEKM